MKITQTSNESNEINFLEHVRKYDFQKIEIDFFIQHE